MPEAEKRYPPVAAGWRSSLRPPRRRICGPAHLQPV